MDRRDFLKASAVSAGALALGGVKTAAAPAPSPAKLSPGQTWPGWKKGHFQVHFIHTGVGESAFYIFPDGTTMLLDCGDHRAESVPNLPHNGKHAGEWIARYVERVNPHGTAVDYMMLSHYHSDHGGCRTFYDSMEMWEGQPYYYSGFALAAKTLTFGKAFDRCYPDLGDPVFLPDDHDGGAPGQMRRFYQRMEKERKMPVEKFKVGAVDQIKMVHNAAAYPGFSIRNICGCGRVAYPDGTIRDLYKYKVGLEHPTYEGEFRENPMSIGMVISYGPFRFYTAGDYAFPGPIIQADGTSVDVEDVLSEVCGPADVAKLNHHGNESMSRKLIAALRSQVYVCCTWHQICPNTGTIERLNDRTIYPGDRVLYSTVYPPERRAKDFEKPWFGLVDPSSYDGSHVVLDVEPSGKKFTVTTLVASDESMTVRTHREYKTTDK